MVEKNTENPLVSVIIPVYNREDMIDDAVKSVLASTYEDIEVIVVDDGSADGSVDVVRRINDERVLLLEYGENKGQSFAKNYGVSHSKGQYIAFCDSDDEWDPEKLSKQMERLISEGGRVVYCPFTKQYEDGKRTILRPGGGLKAEGDLFQELLRANYIDGPTILMERSLFDEVGGFDEELRCHEDYDFILKIAKTREILYVDEPLYHKHDLSESVNKNVKYYLEATLMLIDRYRSDYIRFGLLEEKVGRVMEEAKAYGCLDQVAAILQQILA